MSTSWTVRFALASCTLLPLTGMAYGQAQVPPQKTAPGAPQERQAQPNQANNQNQANTQNPNAQRGAVADRSDQQLAQLLIDCDDIEVAVSHAVTEKTSNDQVKSFAQKMVKEHTEAKQKLSQLVGLDATRQVPPAEVRRNAVSGQQPNTQQPSAQPNVQQPNVQQPNAQPRGAQQARQANQPVDFVALSHELKEQCRTSALAEIDKKKGHELDACYIGMQLASHKMALDKIKVFKNHASPALQSHLDERQKAVEEHLEIAEKVMKDLADESRKSAKND